VHSYRAGKHRWGELRWAEVLVRAGYRVVMPDLRGHGASTGDVVSFGPREAADLAEVLDRLEAEGLAGRGGLADSLSADRRGEGAGAGVLVMGISLGGSVGLHWAASDQRVLGVVCVSTPASLGGVLRSFLHRYLWPVDWALPESWYRGAAGSAALAAGVTVGQADATGAIARIGVPVLLVHAATDREVPVGQAKALQAAGGANVELMILPEGEHFDLHWRYLDRLEVPVLGWMGRVTGAGESRAGSAGRPIE
jgi:pimeloyl-ACP methyl ester carboxylesterase